MPTSAGDDPLAANVEWAASINTVDAQAGGRKDLVPGKSVTFNDNEYSVSVVHDRLSMVTRYEGGIVDYREFSVNGYPARTSLLDFSALEGRTANYSRRLMVFSAPIEISGSIDRVFIEGFCKSAESCNIASALADTVRFKPVE